MRTITVRGQTLPVLCAGVSPFVDRFKSQIYFGEMGIGQLAGILDGNDGIIYDNHETGDHEEYVGYSRLTKIEFIDDETVVVFLNREAEQA